MDPLGWDRCPDTTRHQVHSLIAALQQHLGGNLVGIYLHGSLAMGCFHPAASDLDLLVITRCRIPATTRRALVELLLAVSGSPHPVEIHFLHQGSLRPWQHPTPFELHYSEEWRKPLSESLAAGEWERPGGQPEADPDLAAHIAVTRERGICLWGEPVDQVFPPVPREDYLDSIISDLHWAREQLGQGPDAVYGILNACRVYACWRDGRVLSKDEGAVWGLDALPPEFHPAIRAALNAYRSGHPEDRAAVDEGMAVRLVDYVLARVEG